MNENRQDWKEFLSKLDTHEAPDQFEWDALNSTRDRDWKALLNQLPPEIAPDFEMKAPKEALFNTIFKNKSNLIKIAAGLLLLLSVWMFWPLREDDSSIVLTTQLSEQTLFAGSIYEAVWSLDEFCAAYEIKCDQQELGQFREEWEEVSTAILLILESLEYNQDDEFLLRQLSTLETRHSELVNELIKIVWS